MKVSKKILVIMVSGLFAICTMPGLFSTVQADDNDTFLVTMSGGYLECNIINASWDIGVVAMNNHYWTNETDETEKAETYNSTAGVNLDFEMVISSDAADWKTVWAQNYTTGANKYKLNATSNVWVAQTALNVTTYADVKTGFAPAANATFDLRFDAPVSTTTGSAQSITLTGKVTVA